MKLGMQYRSLEIDGVDDSDVVSLAISSEYPVPRDFGNEILSHKPQHIDFSRSGREDGMPLLLDHDPKDIVGRVHNVRVVDGVLRGEATFSRSQKGQDVLNDIKDRIRTDISVGYFINHMTETRNGDLLVDNWTPFEASSVSVPADPTVGFGRSATTDEVTEVDVTKYNNTQEESEMDIKEPVDVEDIKETEDQIEQPEVVDEVEPETSEELEAETPADEVEPELEEESDEQVQEKEPVTEERSLQTERPELNTRHQEMRSVAKFYNANELGERAITENWTDEQFRSEVLKSLTSEEKETKMENIVGKAILDVAHGRSMDQAVVRGAEGNIAMFRDGQLYSDAKSSALVPDVLKADAFIEFLGPKSLLAKMVELGMSPKVYPAMQGNISLPRQKTQFTAGMNAEDVASVEQTLEFEEVPVTPAHANASGRISRNMKQMTPLAIEGVVTSQLRSAMVQNFDAQLLNGDGTGDNAKGIMAYEGTVRKTGAAIGSTTRKHLQTEVMAMRKANIYADVVHLMNYETAIALSNIKVMANDSAIALIDMKTGLTFDGVPFIVDDRVPATKLVTLAPEHLIAVTWGEQELQVNAPDDAGATKYIMFADYGFALEHADAIRVVTLSA